jgi:hypothetical protein
LAVSSSSSSSCTARSQRKTLSMYVKLDLSNTFHKFQSIY